MRYEPPLTKIPQHLSIRTLVEFQSSKRILTRSLTRLTRLFSYHFLLFLFSPRPPK